MSSSSIYNDSTAGVVRGGERGSSKEEPSRAYNDFVLARRTQANASASALTDYKRPKKLFSLKSFMKEHGVA